MTTIITFPGAEPPQPAPAELPYIEPSVPPEIFAADLARVHVFAQFTRLVFTAPELPYGEAKPHNVAKCYIVVPTAALSAICKKIGEHLPETANE